MVLQARTFAQVVTAVALSLLALTTGCAGADDTREDGPAIGSVASEIIGGHADEGDAKGAAVVALRIGQAAPYQLCTGTLVAPNVVLTARHCVTEVINDAVECSADGTSMNGPHLGDDVAASKIHVFTGSSPDVLRGTPDATATEVVHAGGKSLCNADIALVVLDRSFDAMAPLPVRLQGRAVKGETVDAIGYGKNDSGLTEGTRIKRGDVRVLDVGKGMSESQTALGDREFELGTSTCHGDSGGPAIDARTGAVVGVMSRGGSCDDSYGHVFTSTAGFDSLFTRAYAVAGTTGTLEVGGPRASAAAAEPAPTAAGCSMALIGGTGTGSSAAGALLVALGMAAAARRRR